MTSRDVKVADEVWIAAALLQREHPDRDEFSLKDIEQRLKKENLAGGVRPGVYPHISVHCVANVPPNPGRYRMLLATGPSRRRLFREGDPSHPKRDGAKTHPRRADVPPGYHELIDWYELEWANPSGREDPLLALAGTGRSIWRGESIDEFLLRLRKGES